MRQFFFSNRSKTRAKFGFFERRSRFARSPIFSLVRTVRATRRDRSRIFRISRGPVRIAPVFRRRARFERRPNFGEQPGRFRGRGIPRVRGKILQILKKIVDFFSFSNCASREYRAKKTRSRAAYDAYNFLYLVNQGVRHSFASRVKTPRTRDRFFFLVA